MKRYFMRFCITLLLFVLMAFPALAADVPAGYSVLEYIQSSGTQYIDTGVYYSDDISLTLKYQLVSDQFKAIFGTEWSTSGSFLYAADGYVLNYASYGVYTTLPNSDGLNINTVTVSGKSVNVNGSITNITGTGSNSTAKPFYLYWVGDEQNPNYKGVFRTYSFQISKGGSLVRDYVPVKNPSGVVGLWDKVNGEFVGNSGTGSFVAGSVVEVIPYPEYQVTVNGSYSSNSGAGSYVEGATVTLEAGSRDGFTFAGWSTSDVSLSSTSAPITYFKMPAKAVTVTANWTQNAPTYQVTVNGSYSSNSGAGSYIEGVTVNISAGNREGYKFIGWTSSVPLADSSSSSTSFMMPAEAVTVTANWEELPPPPVPSDFDGWTPLDTYQLFSSNADVMYVGAFSNDEQQYMKSVQGSMGSVFLVDDYDFWGNTFWYTTYIDLGGRLLEAGKTYRIRIVGTGFDLSDFEFRDVNGDPEIIASTYTQKDPSNEFSSASLDLVVRPVCDCYLEFASDYFGRDFSRVVVSLSGVIQEVQPTASGDSFSSTTSDIENKVDQINKAEEQIFSDLDKYSSTVDPSGFELDGSLISGMSFISNLWGDCFNQLGRFQMVITYPLFLGIALLFIGRASAVIVSSEMKAKKNNDKKGGGKVG